MLELELGMARIKEGYLLTLLEAAQDRTLHISRDGTVWLSDMPQLKMSTATNLKASGYTQNVPNGNGMWYDMILTESGEAMLTKLRDKT